VLDPVQRSSEVLFGLIMVLTFTGSFSVATAGRQEMRTMLLGAIGCNLAWGIVDGVMYVMASVAERGRRLTLLHAVRRAADLAEAQRIISDALPPLLASLIRSADLESMRRQLEQLPEPPRCPSVSRQDVLGAVAVFLLVFLSTFPVVTPFLLMSKTWLAMRVSNGIAVVMLFVTGCSLGRYSGQGALRMGLSMVAIGAVLVLITMALGG
jgi:VIT1/CCC1 family predicted Fe2+/Mn2+ transporter